jgi:hypothetical protein
MFRVVLPPIIRSAYNLIYSIFYLSHRYSYLPLSWRSWHWFECAKAHSNQLPAAVMTAAGNHKTYVKPEATITILSS